jgi:cobalt/nickel transport protein
MTIKDSDFGGADGQAEEIILEINPDYKPWAENLLIPPGGETEGLLFALQAALGAGVIGCGFGFLWGRLSAENKNGSRKTRSSKKTA